MSFGLPKSFKYDHLKCTSRNRSARTPVNLPLSYFACPLANDDVKEHKYFLLKLEAHRAFPNSSDMPIFTLITIIRDSVLENAC